jgi:hypothetical protein
MVYLSVSVKDLSGDFFFFVLPSLLIRQIYGVCPAGVVGSHHALR